MDWGLIYIDFGYTDTKRSFLSITGPATFSQKKNIFKILGQTIDIYTTYNIYVYIIYRHIEFIYIYKAKAT